jgi:transposase
MDEQNYRGRIRVLEDRNQALEDELALEKARAEHWKRLYLEASQRRFGKSSEVAGQLGLNLFDEAELESLADAQEHTEAPLDEQKVRSYTRRASRNRSLTVGADTPVVDIEHGGTAPACPCGSTMEKSGEFIRETIAVIPATKVVVRHRYPQYSCPACLGEPGERRVVTVGEDPSVLGGTICDPTLLATVVVDKMRYGLPLYRQEQRMAQLGMDVSRQAMSGWMMLAGSALEPLERAMERSMRRYVLWNVDETGLRVLKVPGQGQSDSARNCFMAVRAAVDRDGSRGPVLFTFLEHRTNERIAALLRGYAHTVQSDGLAAYAHAAKHQPFTALGCMVHARRKAADILKTSKASRLAGELVALYGTFFHHEGQLLDVQRGASPLGEAAYLRERLRVLQPDLDAIKAWLDRHRVSVLKGSALETAINYPLERWEQLVRFLDYPWATSSNQLAENCIRPFALDRKNFLFCITPRGARVSALYFSLVESCKALGIDEHAYLTHVFSHAGSCTTDDDWDAMTPDCFDPGTMHGYYALLRSARPDPHRTKPYILRGKKR